MRLYEKFLILIIAICVSVLGFNLIASSSVSLLKVARESGYGSIQNYLAKCDTNLNSSENISQISSKLRFLRTCLQLSDSKSSLLEKKRLSVKKAQDQ